MMCTPIKPVYTMSQLAQLIGQSRRSTERLMLANGVRILRMHHLRLVDLASLRDALPSLWESIVLARSLSNDTECTDSAPTRDPWTP
jgi:hypothetical protein